MTVVLWLDAGVEVGLGHVSRGLAVADALAARGAACRMALPPDPTALAWIAAAGHTGVLPLADPAAAAAAVARAARGAVAVVVDRRERLSPATARTLGAAASLVLVDDTGPAAAVADLVVAPFARAAGRGWLTGPAWVPLRTVRPAAPPRRTRDVRLLVAMGGSDPGGLTPAVVEALAGLAHPSLVVETMANPASPVWLRLVPLLAARGLPPARPVEPGALVARLALSDVAVLAFGVSVYEAMATGVPTVAVCRGDDDAAHADTLAARGAVLRVGPGWRAEELRGAVAGLVADPRRRRAMRDAGLALVDGRGAGRVADAILALDRRVEGADARGRARA